MKELIAQRDECYYKLKVIMKKINIVNQMKCNLDNEYCKLKNEYHRLDRELALKDGRRTYYSCAGTEQKEKKQSENEKKSDLKMLLNLPLADRLMIVNALKDLQEGNLQ